MIEARPRGEARAGLLAASLAALKARNFAEAERLARALAASDVADAEALLPQGLALDAAVAAARAAPLLQQVAQARPGFAHPCRDLAQLLPDALHLVAAQFRACRRLAPQDERLAFAYADFLRDSGRAAAAAVLRALLRRAPGFGPAHNLFGMALLDLGDMPGAIAALQRAVARDATDAAAWSNLGVALKIEGRFAESFAAHDRAVARAPQDAQVRLNRAVALLRAGRMAEAWPDYESRLRPGTGARFPRARLLPGIGTLPNLAGSTVLVWHEEGFGDTLQFARYLPLLAALGARVAALVPPELARLFATLDGVAEILTAAAEIPAFDWHCPFFSLPRAFGTTLSTIPGRVPYLRADRAEADTWAERLPRAGLRVGLVWAGQARPWLPGFATLDARRSCGLAALAPLAEVPGLSLVSLQKGPAAAEAQAPPAGMTLADPMPLVADFAATAAIVANLDAVVSVDTAVAHLAGALARPVFLLDRYDGCWRWLAGREDSPWYPTLRVFRQPRIGDWAPVVEHVAIALAMMAERAGHSPPLPSWPART
jgi:tetratricopeptide (TPR) repeat protein